MYLLVDCNNFFVSCERVFNRSLEHRPVAVLSNNDGCVVARSPEFKTLNIPMGTPYFKLKPIEKLYGITFLSSNYELYADMSRRVMSILRDSAPKFEQYSIDEAFLQFTGTAQACRPIAEHLRAVIRQWTGLPVGIGIAPSKTLAKAASKLAKKSRDGVFAMQGKPPDCLADFPVEDVWGIGHRLRMRLHYLGIDTAAQLAAQDVPAMQRQFSVCLARTILELNGQDVIPMEETPQPQQTLICSKAFGTPITTREELNAAFALYIAEAARRLREKGQKAAGAMFFVHYANESKTEFKPDSNALSIAFQTPTANTSEMMKAARDAIPKLFREHTRHRKCGVMLFGLENELTRQLELFREPYAPPIPDGLYATLDDINRKFGKNAVFAAAQGTEQPWAMQRQRLSRRFTTAWEDLPIAT